MWLESVFEVRGVFFTDTNGTTYCFGNNDDGSYPLDWSAGDNVRFLGRFQFSINGTADDFGRNTGSFPISA